MTNLKQRIILGIFLSVSMQLVQAGGFLNVFNRKPVQSFIQRNKTLLVGATCLGAGILLSNYIYRSYKTIKHSLPIFQLNFVPVQIQLLQNKDSFESTIKTDVEQKVATQKLDALLENEQRINKDLTETLSFLLIEQRLDPKMVEGALIAKQEEYRLLLHEHLQQILNTMNANFDTFIQAADIKLNAHNERLKSLAANIKVIQQKLEERALDREIAQHAEKLDTFLEDPALDYELSQRTKS